MRLALLVVAIAGCNAGEQLHACTIDPYVDFDAPLTVVDDCGTFDRGSANYTDAAMSAAHDCVVNDIANNRGFRLLYDSIGSGRGGFAGTLNNGKLTFVSYASRSAGDMGSVSDFASQRDCSLVQATPMCTPVAGLPCLDCIGTELSQVLCDN